MIKVISRDERGVEEAPYGYVHFSDGTRLAYAPHTSGLSNPLGLFPSKGWGPVGEEHYAAATAFLTAEGLS